MLISEKVMCYWPSVQLYVIVNVLNVYRLITSIQ